MIFAKFHRATYAVQRKYPVATLNKYEKDIENVCWGTLQLKLMSMANFLRIFPLDWPVNRLSSRAIRLHSCLLSPRTGGVKNNYI